MGARFYLPSVGRFASADTIVPDPGNPQSYNRFSYVLNNPIAFTDPSRNFSERAVWGPDSYYDRSLSQIANGEGVIWGGWYEIENSRIVNIHYRPSVTTIYGQFSDNVAAEAVWSGIIGGTIGAAACIPAGGGIGAIVCGGVASAVSGSISAVVPERYNIKEGEVLVVSVGHAFIYSDLSGLVYSDDNSLTYTITGQSIRIMGPHSILNPIQILNEIYS